MMRGQPGSWDIDERHARLSEASDPLEGLNAIVPWQVFRKPLTKALKRSDVRRAGRPSFPDVQDPGAASRAALRRRKSKTP
jgi:hypothetical protein